ncbi:hypothetical protein Glove_816420g3 [Diversispora epigaea]|uniref:Uncharacterized protein n=1 Tax=Diversispora epigaea TaxID=1348612 RepID=A0A397G119_9GLOM|nr:hypothetical protein Glove_816420g3 [Diversispora epigaea]
MRSDVRVSGGYVFLILVVGMFLRLTNKDLRSDILELVDKNVYNTEYTVKVDIATIYIICAKADSENHVFTAVTTVRIFSTKRIPQDDHRILSLNGFEEV